MSSIRSKIIYASFILLTSLTLLFAADFLIGGYLLGIIEPTVRVKNLIYHHDLGKKFNIVDKWGPLKYRLCTDANGFKASCHASNSDEKNFDIAFIGDSFTEGIGLPYEETFVGVIAHNLPTLKIANLGVSSYSPSIYLSKVKYLLDHGFFFKELIVYIDISDIRDEVYYIYSDGVVTHKNDRIETAKPVFSWGSFPLINRGLNVFKSINKTPPRIEVYDIDYPPSAWTYNLNVDGYLDVGAQGGIDRSLNAMTELSKLLRSHGISLSIGVYPWPAQLLYDREKSKQVILWQKFCEKNCRNFYNSFTSFFALKKQLGDNELIANYFILNDVHHSKKGAEVIAKDFLGKYKKPPATE